ncbi:unnamed protein product [Orchesella dallaii]|uniref:Uncharacterized protein n=1 Tax=Orchesella dallaii TaxID=48710 RepID=A0ABP1RN37_9HEXA
MIENPEESNASKKRYDNNKVKRNYRSDTIVLPSTTMSRGIKRKHVKEPPPVVPPNIRNSTRLLEKPQCKDSKCSKGEATTANPTQAR